ncbi:uncharacterized protein LOC131225005 [Magnolia sinica]|uniref:uncharacterized protein LOC131225005 n=1 Tax=Magnolia sinica TaxID=86752 RepID=UPI00265AFE11|nr:uncharacterized protein LOC131225005 [Magnolia sinica]
MESMRKEALAIVATFLFLHLQMADAGLPRVCANQFSLAAQACSLLPTLAHHDRCHESGCDDETDSKRHRRHRHRLENCCRWLKELDDVCVCSVFSRLPLFLTTPDHTYTVEVGGKCKFRNLL